MSLLSKLFGSKGDISGAQSEAEGVLGVVSKLFDKNEKEVARLRPIVEQISKVGEELRGLSDDELKARSAALKQRFQDEVTTGLKMHKDPVSGEPYDWRDPIDQLSWTDDYNRIRLNLEKEKLEQLLPEAFALVREAGDRTIGLRHFDVQMMGGIALHQGKIAEMRTGEGKTLVATSPAYLNALTGRGVHVVTVNDYLAERDANWMRPIYEFLGLTVAFLQNDMDPPQRQQAYAADILYGTNSEFGFDYLRDNMARTVDDVVERPLNYAIIDEVDNILIDEARTPLIISAQVAKTERALRRQQMAKTCDTVAKKLMPAVTDREVEAFIDEYSTKTRIDVLGLANAIFKRGPFAQAAGYLIDAYLHSDLSARTDNAARLLDVAELLEQQKLINEAGHDVLKKTAIAAVRPAELRAAWRAEIDRLLRPFVEAYAASEAGGFVLEPLVHGLAISEEAALELGLQMDEAEDKAAFASLLVADEMSRRGIVDERSVSVVASAVGEGEASLRAVVLNEPGSLSRAEALINDNVPAEGEPTVEQVRQIVGVLEEIAAQGLLPFQTQEALWGTVQLKQGRQGLRTEIADTITKFPGTAAAAIAEKTESYSAERTAFLNAQAEKLKSEIPGHPSVATRAGQGAGAQELNDLLRKELAKAGAFAQAIKAVAGFIKERKSQSEALAGQFLEELNHWVEVPRDAKKALVGMIEEGGRQNEVEERLVLAVRDLPGDASELKAIATDMAGKLQSWRDEAAVAFVEKLNGILPLPEESQDKIRTAIEDGEFNDTFEDFVGQQLLASDQIASLAAAIEAYGERWDGFKKEQNSKLTTAIGEEIELNQDTKLDLLELLSRPLEGKLSTAIFGELAGSAVAAHLEPLLTDEDAPAFTDEIKRRIPLAKDVAGKLKPSAFAGRSAGQLARVVQRLVISSLESTATEDYKRVVKNLGWLTEKDEKRRTAAVTDMGSLVAEREAGQPIFTDPDNFLETLLQGEILTEEEAVEVQRAQVETPDESLTKVIDRVLRLPAERRRRLAEAKLQEVQPVLDQGIKAHALFEYNVNYVIGNGREIVIVDEFTGRTMPGRRFSEGLHEALEAKHGLEVQIESQTVATITIQNYFRLYNKLSGLTGTAKTEETEFAKTYHMEVLTVPTNRQIRRVDEPDVVYKTAEAKLRAITFDLLEHHCAGQPVLVGTRSVEMSERMSQRLSAAALQTLVLAHLIKDKIWHDKEKGNQDEKNQMLAFVRQPLLSLNPLQVKGLAKQLELNPEATADENVDRLLSLFTIHNADRTRLLTALKQGLAHNVLNAKNHRNEARIIAEAARPGSVTIATNMAGRGVDIILGGSLDGESRWRVITQQLLARAAEGKVVHVRSRNAEATEKLAQRLNPEALQQLAWAVANIRAVDELERTKVLEGQAAKDMKDALGGDLMAGDFANRVRARARRHNLLEKLPVDIDALDDVIIKELAGNLEKLMGRPYAVEDLRTFLSSGLPAQEIATHDLGRDQAELAVLWTIARPLAFSQDASEKLLDILSELPDLDRNLLELVSAGGNLKPEALAANLEYVGPGWVQQRLQELNVPNSQAAKDRIPDLPTDSIEVNEFQIAVAMGENFMGTPWLRQRLTEWQLVEEPRMFEGTPEQQQALQDQGVAHLRLQKKALAKMRAAWSLPHRRREMVGVEAPNLVLLQELAQLVGPDAPILEPQWLHGALSHLGILQSEEDIFQAQMMAQVQDEQGNQSVQPIDILVYKIRLARMLESLVPVVRSAAKQVGQDPEAIFGALENVTPYLSHFADADWIKKVLAEAPDESEAVQLINPAGAPVQIETGVAGQSADIALESEARPEDIAHTSEQELVKELGGLHIIGTERHESRRIDNQLRGRAGRQGDPGSSRFYISLDDELWRLFGNRGHRFMAGWDEDEPVEHKFITKSIERAQKKVELNHFESRKHVLQYDDVMNVQREVIYRRRRRALAGEDIRDMVLYMAESAAVAEVEKHCPRDVRPEEYDTRKAYLGLGRLFGLAMVQKHLKEDDLHGLHWVTLGDFGSTEYDVILSGGTSLREVVGQLYEEREEALEADTLRPLERWQVMRSIDEYWMEHLAEMDYLRDAIWQQGYAQKEPIGVFRQEGYVLFNKMLAEIYREVTESIFSYQLPNFTEERATLDIGALQEARLLEVLPMDDGIDDGTMLDKDDDGDEPVLIARQPPSAPRNAGTTVTAPSRPAPVSQPQTPHKPNRAERRAKKKGR